MSRKQLTPHFSIEEFDCHNGTKVPKELEPRVEELAKNLEVVREALDGTALNVVSGWRSHEYQMKVNPSAPNSQHPEGRAADLTHKNFTPAQVADKIEELIREKKIKQGGVGRYRGFTHYDIRGKRARWDYT